MEYADKEGGPVESPQPGKEMEMQWWDEERLEIKGL
jgi:hypothetical protein